MNIHEDDFSFKVIRETLNFNSSCLKPKKSLEVSSTEKTRQVKDLGVHYYQDYYCLVSIRMQMHVDGQYKLMDRNTNPKKSFLSIDHPSCCLHGGCWVHFGLHFCMKVFWKQPNKLVDLVGGLIRVGSSDAEKCYRGS